MKTKAQIAEAQAAVIAELPKPVVNLYREGVMAAAAYAATCTVCKASFTQTRPPVPGVYVKAGRCKPAIRVTVGMIYQSIAAAHVVVGVGGNTDVWKTVAAALEKVFPSLEARVADRCQTLMNDSAAVQRKKDQLAEEDRRSMAAARARLVREFKVLQKSGFSESDVVAAYREALVSEVLDA